MNIEIRRSIERMSGTEKVELMEALWDDMLVHSESLPSLSWHKRILDERRQLALDGKAHYTPLDDVERRLLRRFS